MPKPEPKVDRATQLKQTHDTFLLALHERRQYEFKLSRLDAQLYAHDRPEIAGEPWIGASNVRFQLASLMLDDWFPDLAFMPYSSEVMAGFDTLDPQMWDFRTKIEKYFDQLMKLPEVNFREQYLYFCAKYAHYGEGYLKVTWDEDDEGDGLPYFEDKHPLEIITPSNAKSLKETKEFVEVIQLTEEEFFKAYGKTPDNEAFLNQVRILAQGRENKLKENKEHDTSDIEQQMYDRIGINRSGAVGKLVLWIHHFKEEGKSYWETLSPDIKSKDFKDKTDYPDGYEDEWMIIEAPWEYIEQRRGAARGVTEKISEAEYSATKAWQAHENFRALTGQPIFSPYPNQELPSTTQNWNIVPGSIAPQPLQVMEFPSPPSTWTEARLEFEEYGTRMAGRTNKNVGQQLDRDKNKTATEERREAFESDKSTNFRGQLLTMFLQRIYTVTWGLIVANKPKSLAVITGQGIEQIPEQALSANFILRPKGSMEQINKEFRLRRQAMILEAAVKLPIMTPQCLLNIWRSYVHELEPNGGDEFVPDIDGSGQDEEKAAMLDSLTLMMGGDIQPKPGQNDKVRAEAAMKLLLTAQELGWHLPQQSIQALSGYVNAHKQMMQKQNPKGFQDFMQSLNMLDVQTAKHQAVQAINANNNQKQAQLQASQPGNVVQMPPQAAPQPSQTPQQGQEPIKISESITVAFKDLPMAAQIQVLGKLGITVTPNDFHDQLMIETNVDTHNKLVDHNIKGAQAVQAAALTPQPVQQGAA